MKNYKLLILFLLFGKISFSQNEIIVVKDTLYVAPTRPDIRGSSINYQFSLMGNKSYNPIGDSILIKVTSILGSQTIMKIICFKNLETKKIEYSTLGYGKETRGLNILFKYLGGQGYNVFVLSNEPEKYCNILFEVYSKSQNRKIKAESVNLLGCK